MFALWKAHASDKDRSSLRSLDLHVALPALWTLHEFSVIRQLCRSWLSLLSALLRSMTTSTINLSRRRGHAILLRSPLILLFNAFFQVAAKAALAFKDPLKDPVHLVNAVPQDDLLRFDPLSNQFHVIFHLSSQVGFIELYPQMLIGIH